MTYPHQRCLAKIRKAIDQQCKRTQYYQGYCYQHRKPVDNPVAQ